MRINNNHSRVHATGVCVLNSRRQIVSNRLTSNARRRVGTCPIIILIFYRKQVDTLHYYTIIIIVSVKRHNQTCPKTASAEITML